MRRSQPRFRELLKEALKYFADAGFTSEADLEEWLLRLHRSLEAELPTDSEERRQITVILSAVFNRDVLHGGIAKKVPGISRYTLDRIAPSLRAELDRRIWASADLIKLNKAAATQKTLQRFSGWVTSVPRGGSATTNIREAAGDVMKSVAQLKFERRRVAIDQGHKLSAAVAHVVAQGQGAIACIWHDRGEYDRGYDARPEHIARSGKIFLVRDSWAMNEGLVKKGGLKYTDEIEGVAELPFCFPGSTRVPLAAGVRVGYRRWYSGELTEIVTASGKTLRATPNHPMLTPHGWVACGALKESDDLIEVREERIDGSVAKTANDDAVPTIAEVFGALEKAGKAREVSGRRDQFHGDGSECDVDIVDADRPLTFDFVTARAKGGYQLSLAESYLRRAATRALQFLIEASTLLAARFVGGLNAIASPFGSATLQMNSGSIFHASNRATSGFDPSGNRESADAEFGGERLHGLAGLVAPSKIVSVKRLDFTGHVYNLQTATGYYAAEGIISHNCSCWYEYVTSPRNVPPELLTAKGRAWVDGRGWVAGIGPQSARHDSAVRADPDAAGADVELNPTPAQLESGNYRKGHVRIAGVDVAIETPRNALRRGVGADGRPWSVAMPAHYGYVKRTVGADSEQLDCYIGPNVDAPMVWVVDQLDARTGEFDEHKAMIGFNSRAEALSIYSLGFSDGMGSKRIGGVRELTVEEFKRWEPAFA